MSYPVYMVPAGDVLPIFFNTYAGATGASVTTSGLAVTDIEIYRDGGTTQRASDAGYTLLDTDGIDFDGLTGIHGFSIDTGDNTDSGFYVVGAWYHVVVSAITVDSQTVSFVAAAFRIMAAEDAAGVPDVNVTHFGGTAGTFSAGRPEVNTTHAAGTAWGSGAITAASIATGAIDADAIAADVSTELLSGLSGLAVNVTQISGDSTAADNLENAFDDTAGAVTHMGIVDQGTAQSATSTTLVLRSAAAFADDELIGATIVITGGSAGVGQARTITDYVSSTDTATVATWTTTPSGTITYKIYGTAPASASSGGATAQEVWEYGTRTLTALDEDSTTIDIDNSVWGGGTRTLTALDEDSTTLDLDATIRAAVGLAAANLDTQLTAIDDAVDAEIGTILTRIGTPTDLGSGASLSANLVDIEGQTDDIGVAGAGLTAAGLSAAGVRAAVGLASANLDTQIATLATAAALDTVDNFLDTEIATLTAGIIQGSAVTGTLSTTQASTNLTGYANDQLIGRVVIWTSGAAEGEASDITDYVETNGVLTFTALTTAPGNGDTFKIV